MLLFMYNQKEISNSTTSGLIQVLDSLLFLSNFWLKPKEIQTLCSVNLQVTTSALHLQTYLDSSAAGRSYRTVSSGHANIKELFFSR